MVGEEKRHQMMQNLFGDQSEEEEEEVDSEHESNPQPPQQQYLSDEAEGGFEPEAEGGFEPEAEGGFEPEAEGEGEGEGEVDIDGEGQGDAEVESDAELHDREPDQGESEGERDHSSEEVDVGDPREESGRKESDSDEKEYGPRVVTSRRSDVVIESGSERSEDHLFRDDEDEEVDQTRSLSKSPDGEKNGNHLSSSAPEIRDVFGDSEDEDAAEFVVQNEFENRSPIDEQGSFEKDMGPEDIIPDEDVARYESEEENIDSRQKERPVGPPMILEVPLRPPPARPDKMNTIKVSNIMGVDPKPFDPKTYVEEDTFVTDESGANKKIRLENNIVRWRTVRNPNGGTSLESNARFVKWSDGSMQLLIGNEVLDMSVQDAKHDQSHLFLRHGKGILQSQGRILRKMRFMPSSLTSNSHRLLTALVDSRHKKVYKVKNCITDIDPEREKEEREKAASQSIRASVMLNRKKEKVNNKKYAPSVDRRRQLSLGFLEDALEEEENDGDYYYDRRSSRRFEDDLEMETRAEKRIMNAKKTQKVIPKKSSLPAMKSQRRPVDFSESEEEESEYETDGEEEEEERSPPPRSRRVEESEPEYEEGAQDNVASEEEEARQQRGYGGSQKRKDIESDEESSPKRKAPTHRRMAVVYDSDDE